MKKIYKTIKSLLLAGLILSISSCSDELTTNSSTAIDSEILSTTAGLNMVLTSAYHYFLMNGDQGGTSQNEACYAGIPGYCMYYDLGGADIVSIINYGGSVVNSYRFDPERTQVGGSYAGKIWTTMYKTINQVNIIMDALPNVSGDDALKTKIKGQCLAMRGICYFHLIMNYQQTYAIAKNKRGVILRLTSADDENKGFSTVQECYSQIVSDLTNAKTLLANYNRDEMWRINADVVSGELARVYQVMGDWANALTEAQAVYQKYQALMTKTEWKSGFSNLISDGCKELVWGIKYTNLSNISSNTEFNYWYNQDPSYGEGMTDGPIYSFINFFVDDKYVSLFDDSDYRGSKVTKTSNVTDNDEKGSMFWHRTNNGSTEISTKWAYNKFKYYGDANGAKQGHTYPEFPLMRGSEMLLIMAEAKANLNKTSEALTDLKTLQTAREVGVKTATASKDELLEAIYKERRKELLGEGVTGMYDLLRLQKPLYRYESSTGHYSWGLSYLNDYNASDAAPYGWLPSNDYRFICQIPQMELANNSAISEKDQNPFSGH
jgi:hypothetical protein